MHYYPDTEIGAKLGLNARKHKDSGRGKLAKIYKTMEPPNVQNLLQSQIICYNHRSTFASEISVKFDLHFDLFLSSFGQFTFTVQIYFLFVFFFLFCKPHQVCS